MLRMDEGEDDAADGGCAANVVRCVRWGDEVVAGSPQSLFAFEDDKGRAYDRKDGEGFIKLNALRLRTRDAGK